MSGQISKDVVVINSFLGVQWTLRMSRAFPRDLRPCPVSTTSYSETSAPATSMLPTILPPPPQPSVPAAMALLFFLPLAAAVLLPDPAPTAGLVGVTYNIITPGLPPPDDVAAALVAAGVTRVLLQDPYPDGIAAFNGTGIALTIALNNSFFLDFGNHSSHCYAWIGNNIVLPDVNIEAISLGYDILSDSPELADHLLPAVKNLNDAFKNMKPHLRIAVTTANSYDLVTPPFPPSAAQFNASVADRYLKPLLAFLDEHEFPFFISLYPYKLYRASTVPGVDIGFAGMDTERGTQLADPASGLVYDNLLDAMVDAVASAMAKLGFAGVRVVVSGTGWPSGGAIDEPETSVLFGGEYNERLVKKINLQLGTPAQPDTTPVTYIYALFDQAGNPGPESESDWGIWTADLQQKYFIDFTTSDLEANGAAPGHPLWPLSAAVPVFWLLLGLG